MQEDVLFRRLYRQHFRIDTLARIETERFGVKQPLNFFFQLEQIAADLTADKRHADAQMLIHLLLNAEQFFPHVLVKISF